MLQIRAEGQSGPHGEIPLTAVITEKFEDKPIEITEDGEDRSRTKLTVPDAVQ